MPSLVDTVYYGRVVRETDSAPISGARVQLLYDFDKPQDGASRVPPEPTPEAQSDAAGYFQISAPFWKPYYGRIDAENHAPILFEMKAGHDTREKAATLSMPFGARIRVAVSRVDLSSAELTVRASVKSYEIARPSGASVILRSNPEWVVKTDKNGVGLLSGIPHTVPIALEVFDRSKLLRRERSALVLNPGEMRIVQIRVGDGVKVRGTAIDQDGQPITHNTVLLLPASDNAGSPPINTKCIGFIDSEDVLKEAKTDHRGRFYLDDIPPGSWWVGISPGRRWDSEDSADAVSPNATRVTIAPGAADVDVLLRAHRGLYIRGRVLQPDGRPSPNGQVFATIHEYESFDTFVKSDGSFALGPLSPGRFQVFASGSSRHVNSEPIEVDAGAQDGL
jgi:hypothetical protein